MAIFGSKNEGEFERLQQENEQLKRSVAELSTLNELTTVINSTMALDKIMDRVVSSSVKAINAEQGTIHLVDKDAEAVDSFKTFIRKADETTPGEHLRLDSELSDWMLSKRQPLLINDFENNDYFINRKAEGVQIKSLLSVPLVCKGELIGVLNLFNKKSNGEFSADDQRMLTIIGSQSAHVIENARLYEQEKHLIEIEKDLVVAHSIQQRLLPKGKPSISGFDVAGASYSAKDVGGDYFDFIKLDNERWFITLGDVSGKGISASLLMSHLQATIWNQAMNNDNVIDAISKANNVLHHNTPSNKFVTLFGGILDSKTRTYSYVNAGHNFPFHFKKDGSVSTFREGGLVLGMMPDMIYEAGNAVIAPGETVVIYSDGVTEARSPAGNMFGEAKLEELVKSSEAQTAKELANTIYNEVKAFEAGADQDDDITVVVIRGL